MIFTPPREILLAGLQIETAEFLLSCSINSLTLQHTQTVKQKQKMLQKGTETHYSDCDLLSMTQTSCFHLTNTLGPTVYKTLF